MKIAISAGHSSKVRGASDIIDEVDEARRVCTEVCRALDEAGLDFEGPYFDDVSTSQDENLRRICDWHNSKARELDVSVHFNANQHTSKPVGTECLYVTQSQLADEMATAIARASGLIDRGPKYRDGLYFLNNTEMPAILIEVCFVDSEADVEIYRANFGSICTAIAQTISGEDAIAPPEPPESPDETLFTASGRCSWFGGPEDTGVSPSEGLAFIYEYEQRPDLFLPQQPPGTTGLARRLDPDVFYIACRWDYDTTPKEMLADASLQAIVRANGRELRAWPADWGPHADTNRVCDLSPGLMSALGVETDDTVEVVYPVPATEPVPPEPVETAIVEIKTTGNVQIIINGVPVDTTTEV